MNVASRSVNLPALAAAVTVILWALSFIAIRAAGHVFSPGVLALSRLAVAVAALAVIAAVVAARAARTRGTGSVLRPPTGTALVQVIAYGAVWFGAYTVVLNWAEQHADAGTTALLVNLAPILVAVFAGLLLDEGFSARLLTGIGIAFSGVALIAVGGGGPHADGLGVALGLFAAVLYAAGVLLQKSALGSVNALAATFWGALAGLVVTLPFLPAAIGELSSASLTELGWVLFLGVGPTAIAFTTWAYALARTSAGAMAATTLAVPALVIVLSWLLLAEAPNPLSLVGGAACLGGVAITRGLIRLRVRNRDRAAETRR